MQTSSPKRVVPLREKYWNRLHLAMLKSSITEVLEYTDSVVLTPDIEFGRDLKLSETMTRQVVRRFLATNERFVWLMKCSEHFEDKYGTIRIPVTAEGPEFLGRVIAHGLRPSLFVPTRVRVQNVFDFYRGIDSVTLVPTLREMMH